MAMSVAENAPAALERTPRNAQLQLAIGSLLGAVYVLFGLWVVLAGLPLAWNAAVYGQDDKPYFNEYLSATLLMMLCGLAAVCLSYVGYQLTKTYEERGLRSGIFFAALLLFASLWITEAAGNLFAEKEFDATVGMAITALLGLALIGGTVFLYLQPAWGRILETAEDQGWFHGTAFKASQGVRVRRGTVIGVLTLGFCGIYTLVAHRTFGFEQPPVILHNDWFWKVPFTEAFTDVEYKIPLMFKIHLLMPLLLAIVLLVFAWRLVNVPAFADFLIATEAEINKVSWTTRRRLIQDTIVVLVTVFLMTMFLFFVDIFWIWCLGNPYVGVLYYNPRDVQQKQQEKNQW